MTRFSKVISSCILSFVALLVVPHAWAQEHFTDCPSPTGENATIIVPADAQPRIDGDPIANGDEIAAFTPRGTCAGAGVWEGSNLAISIWGDDVITGDVTEGFEPGDTITIRIWDASASEEIGGEDAEIDVSYATDPPHNESGEYAPNGIYLVTALEAASSTSVADSDPDDIPSKYDLGANYPNPFNPTTTISYDLAEAGPTRLTVFDMLGRRVSVLVDERQQAGRYKIRFDGEGLPSGSYVYRLESGDFSAHGSMVLMK